jgi:dihydropteroate synthase
MPRADAWKLSDRELDLSEPRAAGIVNVTSDSMWEGSRSDSPEQAVQDGLALADAGFDMLDVGAVAARSGPPVPPEQEAAALVPALRGLAQAGLPISADTFSPEVARMALEAGAVAINDIGGGSPEMFALVASSGCGYVLMHVEGPPREDRPAEEHGDVVAHLLEWFGGRLRQAEDAGVDPSQVVIDPGLDFDLTTEQDLEILRRLEELHQLGRPLYVSLSRKDFIGAVLAGSWEGRLPAADREWGTAAATTLAVAAGAQILRLHDFSSLQALRVAGRIAAAGSPA